MNKYNGIVQALRCRGGWVTPIVLALATAGGISAAGRITAFAADQVASASSEPLADAQSILASRSPGERDAGALVQTKEAYPMLNDASAMPKQPPGDMLIDAAPLPPTDEIPKAFAAIVPPEEATPNPGLGMPGAPPTTPIIVPSETGRTPVPPDQPILRAPPPPPIIVGLPTAPDSPIIDGPTVSAVPEPATWTTMIAGFFMIGGVLRRRPRTHSDRQPAAA